ncbi:putative core protein [Equine molluscum contagiosum-like virus]|nr:putative core protein [Equine molluscum contagiosum-like virus]
MARNLREAFARSLASSARELAAEASPLFSRVEVVVQMEEQIEAREDVEFKAQGAHYQRLLREALCAQRPAPRPRPRTCPVSARVETDCPAQPEVARQERAYSPPRQRACLVPPECPSRGTFPVPSDATCPIPTPRSACPAPAAPACPAPAASAPACPAPAAPAAPACPAPAAPAPACPAPAASAPACPAPAASACPAPACEWPAATPPAGPPRAPPRPAPPARLPSVRDPSWPLLRNNPLDPALSKPLPSPRAEHARLQFGGPIAVGDVPDVPPASGAAGAQVREELQSLRRDTRSLQSQACELVSDIKTAKESTCGAISELRSLFEGLAATLQRNRERIADSDSDDEDDSDDVDGGAAGGARRRRAHVVVLDGEERRLLSAGLTEACERLAALRELVDAIAPARDAVQEARSVSKSPSAE